MTSMTLLPPIRAELFSIERLEQFAEPLAASHLVVPGIRRGVAVLKRCRDNSEALRRAYDQIGMAVTSGEPISPAAEWLVDNYHIVEEQLREIREDLPRGFYRKLPKLAGGVFKSYPRVYAIAWAYVEHTDSRFDPATLSRFVQAYQRAQALTLGELWALAISLRLVLVENLRRLTDRVIQRRAARAEADALAEALLEDPSHPIDVVDAMDRWQSTPLWSTFVAQLAQRLRDRDPASTPVLARLGDRLGAEGRSVEELVQLEHHEQVVGHLLVRNVITSMRLMSSVDWTELVEGISLVEAALRAGTDVAAMDFASRDRYRHAVEDMAQGAGRSELEVAKAATDRANAAERGSVMADPGYYLVGPGRAGLEFDLGVRLTPWQWAERRLRATAKVSFLGGIALVTALILAGFVLVLGDEQTGPGLLVLLALLALIPASDVAVALVNRLVPELLGPRRLLRLELKEGVPAHLRTMVVVPMMLTAKSALAEQIELLETHYLANADGDIRFALLSDWRDAPQEEASAEDLALLAAAEQGIAALNRRHPPTPDGGPRFHLFHRRRLWCESEGRWMGWERKRGKLHEFNRLLRGATDTTFLPLEGEPATAPADVRYVITLDADTRLPRGGARRLIGTIAHPLNRPVYDPELRRVTHGHGLLQPRVAPTLPEAGEGTLHQKIYAGPRGTDAYEFAVSDVYQDLFDEGIFTGKGLYDVDAFEQAMAGRVPDNTMLSHDLFEGVAARAALCSDIELFEDYPPSYEVNAARRHRWTRGDWQLLPWIFGSGPRGSTGGSLPAIGRWKMLDNLRRTLVAPAAVALLVLGWCLSGLIPLTVTAFVIAVFLIPSLLPLVSYLRPARLRASRRLVLRGPGHDLRLAAEQTALALVLLPHQAWMMTDAIARTLWRMTVSHRHMLEWVTAAQAHSHIDLSLGGAYRRMGGAPSLAVAAGAIVALVHPAALVLAAPFITAWLASPAVARWISTPLPGARPEPLSRDVEWMLRSTARQTWHYFERYVTAEDNWLPPDNFQEDPPQTAHRTSPTNIGLYMLAAISARDFGWIGTVELTERLEDTFGTLDKLQTFRGHLYNWYDTRTLAALEPRYISTVDSGNLAGHLIVVRQACLELAEAPHRFDEAVAGIRDTLRVLHDGAGRVTEERRGGAVDRRELDREIHEIETFLDRSGAELKTSPEPWRQLAARAETLVDAAQALRRERDGPDLRMLTEWALAVRAAIDSNSRNMEAAAEPLRRRLLQLADAADRHSRMMRFDFLYNQTQKLFAIGYRPAENALDASTYDLLASEARLASFVAVARGDVPATHWFRLGRPMTPVGDGAALVSWSASMFEYLMPELVMSVPPASLIANTNRQVVAHQIAYGRERGVPWGISESAFNVRDLNMTYQYSNFGVAGLGLKRGLSEDLVIAPYATALAAMVDPAAAARNLADLAGVGARGSCGFYESVDYTADRLPAGRDHVVIRAYMAHHQGMTVVALANVLTGWRMRARFHAEPEVRSAELLLQERMPRAIDVATPREAQAGVRLHILSSVPVALRHFSTPHTPTPRAHLLSNGRYSVMLTVSGSGCSRWNGLAVSRWREDSTRDCWGQYIYLKDLQSGAVWSAGYQPTGAEPDLYEVSYSEERAEIKRRDGSVLTRLEVVVAVEEDVEVRQITLSNLGARSREIELTSYAEIVLATPAADAAHPAFSNLLVQTEFVPGIEALLATRRPRSMDEPAYWAAHLAVSTGARGGVQYETDRGRFIGRHQDVRAPSAVHDEQTLSGSLGPVLDPIFSLRKRVQLAPGATVRVNFVTLVANTRDEVLAVADRYRDVAVFEQTVTQAWTRAQVQLRHLGISPDEAHLFQRLATRLLYVDPLLRAPQDVLQHNRRGPSALWAHGISGDRPIVLLRVDEGEARDIARQLLLAQDYWRMKGLIVDLVFLNEQQHSYYEHTQATLEALGRARQAAAGSGADRGGVFTVRESQVDAEDLRLLLTSARVLLRSGDGTLAEQVIRLLTRQPPPERGRAIRPSPPREETPPPRPVLEFFNGIGGFGEAGQEYVIVLGARQYTPAPWSNVIANPNFGFIVTEAGSGFTWCANSHENQLTPWSNDPVGDPPGEILYLRDEETGEVWTPTPLPIREDGSYVVRHGQGYSRFEHTSHDIGLTLIQFVPPDDPVKISRLIVSNRSRRPREISVTAYVEWVLGPARPPSVPYIVTTLDRTTAAMMARNPWNQEFGSRVAFLDMAGAQSTWTADRGEFIGRNGSLDRPAGLAPDAVLSGRVGGGLDPCAAMQTRLRLAPEQTVEVIVLLGQGADGDDARRLILHYRKQNPDEMLSEVRRRWDDVAGALRVRTPDRAMDLLLNGWLLYQTLGCRVWARAGFYQAGGAFGFRDQLQDTMALAVAKPDVARRQILLAASRQFPEGDVQHWWHPPSGKGVRTHISDDLVWLPFTVAHYLDVTGDDEILAAEVPFIDGPPLPQEQHDSYFEPQVSAQRASLFEHCARALDCRLEVGRHGLPHIGTGDWNDGMNRVGQRGEGESVWMAWFLYATLTRFAVIAEKQGETARSQKWRAHAGKLRLAAERNAWDGDWYRRAYFDDATPLGSASGAECRIDSLSQSWAVLSGAADPARAARAMAAVDEYLVRYADNIVLLLTPPFDKTPLDPGYIKGYLPGIRENGGQYTHAAVWTVMAQAALGDGNRAGELFSLLNPINHARTRVGVQRYKVEPYVLAADVYGEVPHVGRGGWTWYTGSAGWMYRAGIEAILGFQLSGRTLRIDPCVPQSWPAYRMSLRYHSARYEILVDNPQRVCRGVQSLTVDGTAVDPAAAVLLIDDGAEHVVRVTLGTEVVEAAEPSEPAALS